MLKAKTKTTFKPNLTKKYKVQGQGSLPEELALLIKKIEALEGLDRHTKNNILCVLKGSLDVGKPDFIKNALKKGQDFLSKWSSN